MLVLSFCFLSSFLCEAQEEERNIIRIFDEVVFYDGYRMTDNPDNDLEDGVLRHSCSLYAKKLTDEQLDAIGESLDLNVTVAACCDNYDRIGNINIAFVEKGSESYVPETTPRIEIGRFITPFMDKNKNPKEVPYSYEMDYLSVILRDKTLRSTYDLWLEFELFGIPYAANQQIAGCAGRSDVFAGTLEFSTCGTHIPTDGNILIPIVIKKPEYIGGNLNNYKEGATDEIGKTVKTYTFELDEDIKDSYVVLITSNHGANENGEEYNRRWHYVYFDDELVLSYIPGRESCEPFRKYNTQSNGIYGRFSKSDSAWQSFSNWCPGDVIDNRIISLEAVEKGEHKIRIEVPEAIFANQEGDIPVSMYFHGSNNEGLNNILSVYAEKEIPVKINSEKGIVRVEAIEEIWSIEIFTLKGERVHVQDTNTDIDMRGKTGFYVICVELSDGRVYSSKIKL